MDRRVVPVFVVTAAVVGTALAALLAILLLKSCFYMPDFPPPPRRPAPAPVTSNEILVDLTKWDAATSQARRAAAEDVARRLPDFALLRLETFSCGGQTHEVAIYKHEKTGLEFVLVPGLSVMSPASPPIVATFHVLRPILACRTEATQDAWERGGAASPAAGARTWAFRGASVPVMQITADEGASFCAKQGLRLPAAEEWTALYRGGSSTRYFFGDAPEALGEYAWFDDNSGDAAHPVGMKKPNALGLFDIAGNVWEWTSSRKAPGDRIIVGGGSWLNAAENAAVSDPGHEESMPLDYQNFDTGVRPVADVPLSVK